MFWSITDEGRRPEETPRDVKTCQRANNVVVKKFFLRLNLCKILRCFVKKVSNVAFCAFWRHFWHIYNFCTVLAFWAFYAFLLQIRFVVINALFKGKITLAQTMLV